MVRQTIWLLCGYLLFNTVEAANRLDSTQVLFNSNNPPTAHIVSEEQIDVFIRSLTHLGEQPSTGIKMRAYAQSTNVVSVGYNRGCFQIPYCNDIGIFRFSDAKGLMSPKRPEGYFLKGGKLPPLSTIGQFSVSIPIPYASFRNWPTEGEKRRVYLQLIADQITSGKTEIKKDLATGTFITYPWQIHLFYDEKQGRVEHNFERTQTPPSICSTKHNSKDSKLCLLTYEIEKITLRAVPSPGYQLKWWSHVKNSGNCHGSNKQLCEIKYGQNAEVIAIFEPI